MSDLRFQSILWLDDCRMPLLFGVEWVKDFDQFVWHLEHKGVPELLCFDHDLADEHMPLFENHPGVKVPYETYTEKTGYHAAEYVVQNKIPINKWSVHTMNAAGRINIERVLRAYCPQGEIQGLNMPYRWVSPPGATAR